MLKSTGSFCLFAKLRFVELLPKTHVIARRALPDVAIRFSLLNVRLGDTDRHGRKRPRDDSSVSQLPDKLEFDGIKIFCIKDVIIHAGT